MARKPTLNDLENMSVNEVRSVIRKLDLSVLHELKHESMRQRVHVMKRIAAEAELDRRRRRTHDVAIKAAWISTGAAVISASAAILSLMSG